ncbi:hypothetical protein [Sinosporangium siamense]|uniref:Uncharacterized protein n=1 Tax=Sinosporangium siamense TaxID=1367973 RepID=A0A919RE38_9ACTN|nr:hypothetical protein [Sinosporangium siamense]GII92017.1 hypothetical protein Ssi02_22480 [Sinosporangium siamense]
MTPFCAPPIVHSSKALCPWVDETHEALYVDVDDVFNSFDAFTRAFGELGNIEVHGHVVLVTGSDGCGKTALVNKCVSWLHRRLLPKRNQPVIVDLFSIFPEGDHRRRARTLFKALVHQLRADRGGFFTTEEWNSLATVDPEEDLILSYRLLSGLLKKNKLIVLALMPRAKSEEEILELARLALNHIVFFAEIPSFGITPANTIRKEFSSALVPVRIGKLQASDGLAWFRDRERRFPPEEQEELPSIPDDALIEFLTDIRESEEFFTLRFLQKYFCKFYSTYVPQHGGAPISYENLNSFLGNNWIDFFGEPQEGE